MADNCGQVVAYRDGVEIGFRAVGRVTCHHSPALREFAERELSGGATQIVVHLGECTHFDSTFLGTLLFLRRPARARADSPQTSLTLIAPSPEALQVLKQMKATSLFEIVGSPLPDEAAHNWRPLENDAHHATSTGFKRNVVEAHEELAQVPGPLGECFKPLAEHLRRELSGPKSAD